MGGIYLVTLYFLRSIEIMKHSLRVFFAILLLFTITISVISCGNGSNENTTDTMDMCIVSYENTNLENQSVKKGTSILKPDTPDKSGFVFAGWYTDSNYSSKATFPITVNTDLKLYARFYTYQEAFQKARENTIGEAVPGFEYTYTTNISASLLGLPIVGNSSGSAKYSTIGEINYYDESINSGALLFDGSNYKVRRGTTLQNISLDENGKMKKYSVEQVDSNYKYDSSSLAKAIFTYSDDKIKSISPTTQKNIYKLDTTMSVSSVVSLISNYINHPIIEKMLCELPETTANTNLYISFNDDLLDSYTYEFKVEISELQFDLKYTLKFTDVGTAKNIVAKNFENVALSSSDIKVIRDEASAIVDAFKNQSSSGYDFNVDTGVDFGTTTGEINSVFKGSAYRNIHNNTVFFHNDIQIDSDYKNNNLYKDKNIKDVHIKLTKLSNGEVHLIEKKVLTDSTQKINDFVDSDLTSFYLFDILTHSGDYSFAEKTTQNGQITYIFGLTNSGAETLINWLNNSLELDPLNKATSDVLVYGKFNPSSILINNGTVSAIVKDGKLEKINVKIEGDFSTSFEGSAEFSNTENAQLKLNMNIVVNNNGDTFKPFDSVKDAK